MDAANIETDMLIGGAFEGGTEAEEPILNPRTGGTILQLPEASPAQVDRAVTAAREPPRTARTRFPTRDAERASGTGSPAPSK